MKNSMQETREFLRKMGLPGGDLYELPTSAKRFPDGAQYRFEVPGIQGPGTMKTLLEELDRYEVSIHRVTQTKGIMSLTDKEIETMVEYAHKWQVELILAIGPRATTDTSASVLTEEGCRMGYRLRGQEQIVRAIEDIKRAARIGCRGFLVYDEGCLWILNEMRKAGEIPKDCKFKVSAHSGHGNHAPRSWWRPRRRFFQPCKGHTAPDDGGNKAQLTYPSISTGNPKSSGGFIRHYEVPRDDTRRGPLYLKTGGSVLPRTVETTDADAKKRPSRLFL